MIADNHRDRVLGCLLGGAIGDAMGSCYENQSAPLQPNEEQTWQLTDDTQLTLATCEAIVKARRVDPEAIADSFVRWFQERRLTGLGASTLHALKSLAVGSHWALAGRRGEMSAGNGTAMRIAPLAFLCQPQSQADRLLIRDVCRITHHNEEAYAGALAVVLTIQLLAGSADNAKSLLARVAAELPDSGVRDRLLAIDTDSGRASIREIASRFGCSGHVVESVPLAIFAAQQYPEMAFEQIVVSVVECGGDTDTNASIAGQIVGSVVGLDGLPGGWVERVPLLRRIRDTAESLAKVV